MIKKWIGSAVALGVMTSNLAARPHQRYARSFMLTRPVYQHMSTQQATWHDIIYEERGSRGGAIRAMGLYQNSIPMNKTAHYFLPPCREDVRVAGDKTPEAAQCARDIRAEWLGLDSEFRGSFTITPREKQYGCLFEYNQDLRSFFDIDFLKQYWVSIMVPFVAVHHDINLRQSVLNAPVPKSPDAPRDIIEAFQQQGWCYAKIGRPTKSVRPAEIRITIGSSLDANDNYFQFAYNTIFIAPTGNKQNAQDLFEAIAGNNQHFAFGASVFFQFPLNRNTDDYGICFFTNLESIFNIRNTQLRTMDLKNKPWSRYVLFNQRCHLLFGGESFNNNVGYFTQQFPAGQQQIPGVNILTHKVLVRPYGVFDFSMGWRYISRTFEAEFGYNIWGKSNEKVELKRPWFHPCEYEGLYGIAGPDAHTTASTSTIAQQGPQDDTFTFINIGDLDPASAEAGSVLNHKVHIALGSFKQRKEGTLFCVGGLYIDIPQKNAVLRTWGAWLSVGTSF